MNVHTRSVGGSLTEYKIFKIPPCALAAIFGILCTVFTNGEVAQLVEHHVRNVGVESSNLFFSTNSRKQQTRFRPMKSRSRGIFCYPEESEKSGRAPADFVRFIRDRVCETQKELLRLMGESIQLDEEIKVNSDEGINEGINQLLSVICSRPGARANKLATLIGKSRQTVERYIKTLKDCGQIEFRGSKKTGGYFALKVR